MFDSDLIPALVAAAALAPSSHNTQPWRFVGGVDYVDLHADRTRALAVNDPDDRELVISCGVALMNLRIAAAHAGLGTRTNLLPDPNQASWLARLRFDPSASPNAALVPLFSEIGRRRTHRERFAKRSVSEQACASLIDAAAAEAATLQPLREPGERSAVAKLVGEGDARQWADPRWRRELAAWMHPPTASDGLVIPAVVGPAARLIVRAFNLGPIAGALHRAGAEASPLLAALTTEGDSALDWLDAGQALQRVLLTACKHGLQAAYFNQPVQVAELRPKLQAALGVLDSPQLLLCLGHPRAELPPTPRRELAEVLEVALGAC